MKYLQFDLAQNSLEYLLSIPCSNTKYVIQISSQFSQKNQNRSFLLHVKYETHLIRVYFTHNRSIKHTRFSPPLQKPKIYSIKFHQLTP